MLLRTLRRRAPGTDEADTCIIYNIPALTPSSDLKNQVNLALQRLVPVNSQPSQPVSHEP